MVNIITEDQWFKLLLFTKKKKMVQTIVVGIFHRSRGRKRIEVQASKLEEYAVLASR